MRFSKHFSEEKVLVLITRLIKQTEHLAITVASGSAQRRQSEDASELERREEDEVDIGDDGFDKGYSNADEMSELTSPNEMNVPDSESVCMFRFPSCVTFIPCAMQFSSEWLTQPCLPKGMAPANIPFVSHTSTCTLHARLV